MSKKRRVFTDQDYAEIVRRYQGKEGLQSLADAYGVSRERLTNTLRANGVKISQPSPRALPDEQEQEVVSLYTDGEEAAVISERFGINAATVRNIARRWGAAIRGRGQQPRGFSADDIEAIRRMAVTGSSQFAIARALGSSQPTVGRAMQKHGISVSHLGKAGGAHHGSWKGGVVETYHGYLCRWIPPDHPLASMRQSGGYVPEHRLVMAEHLGRSLTKRETVHHIDGNKMNNDLDNLQMRSTYHGKGQAWVCQDCGSHNVAPVKLKAAASTP